ncbi:MAG: RNA methyltransferase [Desulfobacterales bacterium]|nr:RNA methyltransferase [Desulfobacterales bacterium]
MLTNNLYLALIHSPVVNKNGKAIGSALTTIDLHDIARAARTFGVKGFYVVTPFEDQQILAHKIIEHWTNGVGGEANPDRKKALELIRVVSTFEDACADINKEHKKRPVTIGTSAKEHRNSASIVKLKEELNKENPYIMAFGTAWGLSEQFIEYCDMILEPIKGEGEFNHLSVRSAVSIYLDRICN